LNNIASTSRSKFVCPIFAALWSLLRGKKVRPVIKMQRKGRSGQGYTGILKY
jgi:hypothetical protein